MRLVAYLPNEITSGDYGVIRLLLPRYCHIATGLTMLTSFETDSDS